MKKIATVLCCLIAAVSANAGQVDSKSEIQNVTVYPIGAMIERTSYANLEKGEQMVILSGLTHSIDPNTIQVKGVGEFEILSVKFETLYPYVKTKPEGMQEVEDSLKIMQDIIYLTDAEYQALEQERDLLMQNKTMSGRNESVSAEQLEAMAKFFRIQLNEISKKQLKLSNDKLEQNEIVNRLNSKLANMNSIRYEQNGQIIVEVDSKLNEKAQFQFSYFTHLAGWKPKYKIRSESNASIIQVDYHADVQQNTGIDWNAVEIVLSTSRPTFNNQKPTLHPWYLDFQNYQKNRPKQSISYGYEVEMADDVAAESAQANYYYDQGSYKKLEKRADAKVMGATALVNALNTSYKINRKYSIPSNNTNKQLFVKGLEIPAEFSFYTVPSIQKEVFLTASIADWAGYDLVPGRATLFYNKTYVGNSYIHSNVTDDTLQVSLGKDQGIIINHEKVKDLCTEKKIGSNKRKTYVYEISVKNTNEKEVSVVIQDRIPVSKRSEIVVTIKDIAGAEYDEKTGFLKWTKVLKPGESQTLQFSYDIKYPKSAKVNLVG